MASSDSDHQSMALPDEKQRATEEYAYFVDLGRRSEAYQDLRIDVAGYDVIQWDDPEHPEFSSYARAIHTVVARAMLGEGDKVEPSAVAARTLEYIAYFLGRFEQS